MDELLFSQACEKIINNEREKNGIGTLGEKTLHAVLKNYYEPHTENHEIKVGGFVADIVGENGVIEIQTRDFSKLRRKLENFLEFCNVTIVYPIPQIKHLSWMDMETGELTNKRKSPKKGKIHDVIPELYKIKYALDNPRINLCLVMLEVEEIRYLNGWSKDKKKGSSRCDRIPTRLIDEVHINSINDYRVFLPQTLPNEFTSLDYSKHCKITRTVAQTALNIFTYLEIIERIGKNGNTIIYRIKSFLK